MIGVFTLIRAIGLFSVQSMVWVPAGTVTSGEQSYFQEAFYMDPHPVTVMQYAQFVTESGYVTDAEQFGNAGVLEAGEWKMVDGACWKNPNGIEGEKAFPLHPVTQVSWNDAAAYCAAYGKRLPTVLEWEHAARGGRNKDGRYPWGDEELPMEVHQANVWQGSFPLSNTGADGYLYTSPVKTFAPNDLGLYDMSGNVWEWTADQADGTKEVEMILKGGSFLCEKGVCHGYQIEGETSSSKETALFHMGFRCVGDGFVVR